MKGWSATSAPTSSLRDEDTYIFSIGPRARWGDNDFHDAYFGVPVAIPASGLAAYDPHSGFYAIGAMAGLTYKLGRNWGLRGYAGYDRLIGDAADSPIVRAFGSRDQFSGGAGLFFEFNIGGAAKPSVIASRRSAARPGPGGRCGASSTVTWGCAGAGAADRAAARHDLAGAHAEAAEVGQHGQPAAAMVDDHDIAVAAERRGIDDPPAGGRDHRRFGPRSRRSGRGHGRRRPKSRRRR